jgi:hypothetical protein
MELNLQRQPRVPQRYAGSNAILTREQAPADSEASTRQTVQRMAEHIRNSANDPAVANAARQAAVACGSNKPSDLCCAVFYYLKSRVKFVTDDDLISSLNMGRDELELLVSPPVLLRANRPRGDCDDFTMACCAMLHELGIPAQIVTIKADQPDPGRWSHVYCCAQTEKGPMILDTSHGDFPGWEAPYFYAKRSWDSRTGQPLRTEGGRTPKPRRRSGLHGYAKRGLGSDVPDFTTNDSYDYAPMYAGGSPGGPVTSSIDWGGILTKNLPSFINQTFKTIQLGLTPTGGVLVQGPNGQYTISNQAGMPSSLNLGTNSMSMGTILLIGGGVLAVALLMKK